MTNADKYLKDGVDVEELTHAILKYNEENKNCTFYENMCSFWKSEVKPTLTEDETVILKCINKINFQVIGRAKDNELYLYDDDNDDRDYTFNDIYTTLFQFIQPRRRI